MNSIPRLHLVVQSLIVGVVLSISPAQAAEQFNSDFHISKGLTCATCHGTDKPEPFSEVPASKCMECHGSREELANKFAALGDKNPHKNHLGQVECSLCHKGHEKSQAYCVNCHKDFQMPMK